MTSWTADELNRIAAGDELELAARRRDGSRRSPVTIRVVRYRDDLYVRSWRGPTAGWFRAVQASGAGRVSAGGVTNDVVFVGVSEQGVNNAIDVAYRSKYGRSRYATPMVSEPARSTTLKLVPRAFPCAIAADVSGRGTSGGTGSGCTRLRRWFLRNQTAGGWPGQQLRFDELGRDCPMDPKLAPEKCLSSNRPGRLQRGAGATQACAVALHGIHTHRATARASKTPAQSDH